MKGIWDKSNAMNRQKYLIEYKAKEWITVENIEHKGALE